MSSSERRREKSEERREMREDTKVLLKMSDEGESLARDLRDADLNFRMQRFINTFGFDSIKYNNTF